MITVEKIMSWRPCEYYTEKKVKSLVGDGITLLQICDLSFCPGVPAKDRVWLLCQNDVLPEKIRMRNNWHFATRALNRERLAGRDPREELWGALEVLDLFLDEKASWDSLRFATDWDSLRFAAESVAKVARSRSKEIEKAAAWAVWAAAATWAEPAAAARAAAWKEVSENERLSQLAEAERTGILDEISESESMEQLSIIKKSIEENLEVV